MSTFFTVYFLIKILGFFAKNPKIFSAYIAYTTGFFKKKKKKKKQNFVSFYCNARSV